MRGLILVRTLMDLTLIQGAISGLKVASDLTKGFLELKSMTDVQSKVIELQSAILSAQSSALAANAEQLDMSEEIRTLKEEASRLRAWSAEKERYALKALEPGVFTYALKAEAASGEPAHWVCARCLNAGSKFLLQSEGEFYGATEYVCHGCSSKIKVSSAIVPEF